jgi:hypothetical protein
MPGEFCDQAGCELQIKEMCHDCNGSFCPRHIVAVQQGFTTVYLCLGCKEQRRERQKASLDAEHRSANRILNIWASAVILFVGGGIFAAAVWVAGGLVVMGIAVMLGLAAMAIGFFQQE